MDWTNPKSAIEELHRAHGGMKPIGDMAPLYPPFRSRVESAIEEMRALNMEPRVYETFRTDALQTAYYKKGVSKIKTRGMHGFGVAVDIINARLLWHAPTEWWAKMRVICRSHGLCAPFDWDLPHIQAVHAHQQGDIRAYKYPWADELTKPKPSAEATARTRDIVIPALKTLYNSVGQIGLSASDAVEMTRKLNQINAILVNAGLKK